MGHLGGGDHLDAGQRSPTWEDSISTLDTRGVFLRRTAAVGSISMERRQRSRGELVLSAVALLAVALCPLALLRSGTGARTPGARELGVRELGVGAAKAGEGARQARLVVPKLGAGSSILMQGRVPGKPVPQPGWLVDNAKSTAVGWRADLHKDQTRVARVKAAEAASVRQLTAAVRDATDVSHATPSGGAVTTRDAASTHRVGGATSEARVAAAAQTEASRSAQGLSPLARALVAHMGKDTAAAVHTAGDLARSKPLIPSKLSKELTKVISQIVRQAAAHASQHSSPHTAHGGMKSEVPAIEVSQAVKEGETVPSPLDEAGAFLSKTEQGNLDAGLINATSDVSSAVGGVGGHIDEGASRSWLAYKRIPLTYVAWMCAALCVVVTMLLSTKLILRHLDYYANPDTQKYVVRILFMAPIYAVDSLLALTFVGWATTYIDVFRDCYEAFTIYNFLKLLVVLLGGEKAVIKMLEQRPQVPLIFPLQWLEAWEMGGDLFYACKYGALQYVLVKPTCAVVMFVSGAAGIYGPNSFSLARLHFYVFFFSNVSQMWALYCLLMFYVALKQELAPFNPVLKFVIVKAVVFFCFWQGMGLGLLAYMGYIQATANFDSVHIVEAIQELLVCVEMVIVSFLFHKAFPVEEFVDVEAIERDRSQDPSNAHKRERYRHIRQNAADSLRIQDIKDDMTVYGTMKGEEFYGAVQATQEGFTSVIQSARLSSSTPRPPDTKGRDATKDVSPSSSSKDTHGKHWPDPII